MPLTEKMGKVGFRPLAEEHNLIWPMTVYSVCRAKSVDLFSSLVLAVGKTRNGACLNVH